MTWSKRKLIEEILRDYCVNDNAIQRCAADIAKAIDNPRRYRREQAAAFDELMEMIELSRDGDEIIGHRH